MNFFCRRAIDLNRCHNQDHNVTNEPYTPADSSAPSSDGIDPTDAQFDPTRLDDMDYIAAHLASFGFAQGDTQHLHDKM